MNGWVGKCFINEEELAKQDIHETLIMLDKSYPMIH